MAMADHSGRGRLGGWPCEPPLTAEHSVDRRRRCAPTATAVNDARMRIGWPPPSRSVTDRTTVFGTFKLRLVHLGVRLEAVQVGVHGSLGEAHAPADLLDRAVRWHLASYPVVSGP